MQSYAPNVDPGILVRNLGEEFEVRKTIIKKWTTGGPIQSPLDALSIIRARRPFEPADVQRIEVRVSTSAADKIDDSAMPNLSMQQMIAILMLDGAVSFKAAHDEDRMREPRVLREKAKIHVIADENLERLLPRRVAIVEVTFRDGSVETERNDTVRGTPENPMSVDEVAAKARDLMAPVLGSARCEQLIDRLVMLEAIGDITALRPLLQCP
ncbi:MAG: hypothetical protein ACXW2I_01170 [Burkholderiales bacterium]